jgi:hypothetical protein
LLEGRCDARSVADAADATVAPAVDPDPPIAVTAIISTPTAIISTAVPVIPSVVVPTVVIATSEAAASTSTMPATSAVATTAMALSERGTRTTRDCQSDNRR